VQLLQTQKIQKIQMIQMIQMILMQPKKNYHLLHKQQ
jgi:hypothetical protein